MDFIVSPFELPFFRRGLLELLLLSIGAGLVGTWIVLRGLAFYSHAVGTAAFPGLVLADGLGLAAPLGALAAALAFAVVLARLGRRGQGVDSLTALALAGALALGVILASDVFQSGATVDSLLFGSMLLIEPRDLAIAAAASAGAVLATATLGRAWLASGFDPAAARSLGARSAIADLLLLVLVAVIVIASLSALGALLVTALIVTPAATTRIWSSRLAVWRAATVALAALEGSFGLWLSVKTNAPPGATIAVVGAVVFALAALARWLAERWLQRAAAPAAVALALAALGACGGSDAGDAGDRPRVVATTTQIADWAREVGGGQVDLHQVLRPGSDPHEYELRPADVTAAASADLVLRSGGDIDPWARELAEQAGGDPEIVDLGEEVRESRPLDPHWWHDPARAARAVESVGAALARVHPTRREVFERNARAYVRRLRALDSAIAGCMARIPKPGRKLVTEHDALGPFAARYGLEVVGTVIPARTTEAQPSAGELADLAALIEREDVVAVFPERSTSARLARAIAAQTGASAEHSLHTDSLGPAGSDAGTYLGMVAGNADTIARALTRDRVRCARPGR